MTGCDLRIAVFFLSDDLWTANRFEWLYSIWHCTV